MINQRTSKFTGKLTNATSDDFMVGLPVLSTDADFETPEKVVSLLSLSHEVTGILRPVSP